LKYFYKTSKLLHKSLILLVYQAIEATLLCIHGRFWCSPKLESYMLLLLNVNMSSCTLNTT